MEAMPFVCLLIKYTMLMIQAEEKEMNPVKKAIIGTHDTIRMIDAVLSAPMPPV
jgi:hypothetical protein